MSRSRKTIARQLVAGKILRQSGGVVVSGLALGVATLLALPASAQTTIGGRTQPQVEVNLGALDGVSGGSFGQTSFGSGLNPIPFGRPPLPGENGAAPAAGSERIVLKPPPELRRSRAATASTEAAEPAPRAERAPANRAARKTAAAPVELAPGPRPLAPVANAPAQIIPTSPSPLSPVTLAPAPAPASAPAPVAAAEPTPLPPVQAAPAPAAAPAAPTQSQTAMLTPPPRASAGPGETGAATVRFDASSTSISPDGEQALSQVAKQYATSDDRIQLKAYAGSTSSDGGSGARRLSLSRALAVRTFLIERGIRSTRIDVRALGAAGDAGAPDRVDVVVLGR